MGTVDNAGVRIRRVRERRTRTVPLQAGPLEPARTTLSTQHVCGPIRHTSIRCSGRISQVESPKGRPDPSRRAPCLTYSPPGASASSVAGPPVPLPLWITGRRASLDWRRSMRRAISFGTTRRPRAKDNSRTEWYASPTAISCTSRDIRVVPPAAGLWRSTRWARQVNELTW